MRNISRIFRANFPLAATILLVLLAACTHNNGDIGRIGGNWQLTSIDTDVPEFENLLDDDGTYYWSFQNTTIEMYYVDKHHGVDRHFGNFRLTDNTLFLDYPDEGWTGAPLLRLPRHCELQVLKLTSYSMILMYQPELDKQVVFNFRKW